MKLTSGRGEVIVGLIDGPVAMNHPDFAGQRIRELPGAEGACSRASSVACQHGTFIAGILAGRRGSAAPSICPGCTILLRPIFTETRGSDALMPSAAPEQLAAAVLETVRAGARIVNLSAALAQPSTRGERD